MARLAPPIWTRAIYEVSRKEFLDHVRTKRIFVIGGLFAAAFLLLTFITAKFMQDSLRPVLDQFDTDIGLANAVIYIYLTIPLIGGYTFMQLLGIALSWDAVVREWEDKSIFLLLSKPVARSAVFLGKFFGTLVSVAAVFVPVTIVAYFLAAMIVGEAPSGNDMLRALATLGFVVLGLAAFVSIGLFTSTVTRTTTTSVMVALGLWLIVLPLVGQTGFFYELSQGESGDLDSDVVTFFHYFNPDTCMSVASQILLDTQGFGFTGNVFGLCPSCDMDVGLTMLALTLTSLFFLALGLWAMLRRDFT